VKLQHGPPLTSPFALLFLIGNKKRNLRANNKKAKIKIGKEHKKKVKHGKITKH